MQRSETLWPGYAPRDVRQTVLYQTLERFWPTFLTTTAELGTLSGFVEREFEGPVRIFV